jgi:hypothetical protein
VRFRLFKDESTLLQRILAIAILLFLISLLAFTVSSIVLKHSNPAFSSFAEALATTEVG